MAAGTATSRLRGLDSCHGKRPDSAAGRARCAATAAAAAAATDPWLLAAAAPAVDRPAVDTRPLAVVAVVVVVVVA